ncbi:MAG: hypothetical protein QNJ78_01510 [Gammaproteobacteria bacterium]|nr:hypothetical protein [Gammaproteobacteria bacterium]
MNKQRMRGVFDPITAAFILAIAGTILTLSFDEGDRSTEDQSQIRTQAVETVSLDA